MNKTREFREIINLPPVFLNPDDLVELERIIVKDKTTDHLEVTLRHNNSTIFAESVDGLLSEENLPSTTDKLSVFTYHNINEGTFEGSSCDVSLSMQHNYINCQINSPDQTWFLGKKAEIQQFFKEHKPWYAIINQHFHPLPSIAILCLFYSSYLFANEKYGEMFFPIILSIFLGVSSYLIFNQKLFPYVKIVLFKKEKNKFGFNEWCALIAALAGIATLVQVFSNLFK